jgi:hypothetical protein
LISKITLIPYENISGTRVKPLGLVGFNFRPTKSDIDGMKAPRAGPKWSTRLLTRQRLCRTPVGKKPVAYSRCRGGPYRLGCAGHVSGKGTLKYRTMLENGDGLYCTRYHLVQRR